MLIERKTLAVCAALLGVTSIAQGQVTPINLQVDVQPNAVFLAGNMTRVSYVVANRARGTDRLYEFAIQSSVPVWRLEVPTPSTRYLGATQKGSDDVISWGWLDGMPRPGESSPVLAYEAIGLPGIVAYRALRYFGARDSKLEELRFDTGGAEYTVGKTVGVVSLPIDLRPAALTNRLRRLVDQACDLGWVDGAATCQSLRVKVRPSVRALRAFHSELVTHRGQSVTEAAFALLAPNVEFLLGKL